MAVTTVDPQSIMLIDLDTSDSNDLIKPKNTPTLKNNNIVGLGLTQDLKKLGIARARGEILIYDVKTKTQIYSFFLKPIMDDSIPDVNDMKMTEEGLMIFGLKNGAVKIIELESFEEILSINEPINEEKPSKF